LAKRPVTAAASKAGRFDQYKIVVLVPCYNEKVAIAKVVKDFRAALPPRDGPPADAPAPGAALTAGGDA